MSVKIAQALHQVMEKVSYVRKGSKNTFHGYNYASEADLLDKLRPAMTEAGLILIPSFSITGTDDHGNTHVAAEYTLAHKDGDVWPEKIRTVGTGNDKAKNGSIGDKGTYKAITGANKYLLFKLFQIETGDDPEHETAPPPDRKPREVPAINTAPDPMESDQLAYASMFRLALDNAQSVAEVRTMWQAEKKNRERIGLHDTHPLSHDLHSEWLARGKSLAAIEKAATEKDAA